MASGSADRTIKMWDIRSHQLIQVMPTPFLLLPSSFSLPFSSYLSLPFPFVLLPSLFSLLFTACYLLPAALEGIKCIDSSSIYDIPFEDMRDPGSLSGIPHLSFHQNHCMLPLLVRFNQSFSFPFFHHTQHYGAHTDGVTSISMHPVRTTLVLSLLAPLSEITIHPSSPASHLTPSNYLPSPSPSSPPLSLPPSLHCLSFPPSTVSLPLPPLSLSLLPSPQSGYYLVSTSRDSSIKIWDLREGRLLFTLQVRAPCSHVLLNALSYLSICCAFITTAIPSLCLYFQGIFKLSNSMSIILKSFLF